MACRRGGDGAHRRLAGDQGGWRDDTFGGPPRARGHAWVRSGPLVDVTADYQTQAPRSAAVATSQPWPLRIRRELTVARGEFLFRGGLDAALHVGLQTERASWLGALFSRRT